MKRMIQISMALLVLSLFLIGGCNKAADVTDTSGAGNSIDANSASDTAGSATAAQTADVAGAPDISSADSLDEELGTADYDNLALDIDETLFE